MRYTEIKNRSDLMQCMIREIRRNNIDPAHGETFGLLIEGNDLGEYDITIMPFDELFSHSIEELRDMEGYGWAICSGQWDSYNYVINNFFLTA